MAMQVLRIVENAITKKEVNGITDLSFLASSNLFRLFINEKKEELAIQMTADIFPAILSNPESCINLLRSYIYYYLPYQYKEEYAALIIERMLDNSYESYDLRVVFNFIEQIEQPVFLHLLPEQQTTLATRIIEVASRKVSVELWACVKITGFDFFHFLALEQQEIFAIQMFRSFLERDYRSHYLDTSAAILNFAEQSILSHYSLIRQQNELAIRAIESILKEAPRDLYLEVFIILKKSELFPLFIKRREIYFVQMFEDVSRDASHNLKKCNRLAKSELIYFLSEDNKEKYKKILGDTIIVSISEVEPHECTYFSSLEFSYFVAYLSHEQIKIFASHLTRIISVIIPNNLYACICCVGDLFVCDLFTLSGISEKYSAGFAIIIVENILEAKLSDLDTLYKFLYYNIFGRLTSVDRERFALPMIEMILEIKTYNLQICSLIINSSIFKMFTPEKQKEIATIIVKKVLGTTLGDLKECNELIKSEILYISLLDREECAIEMFKSVFETAAGNLEMCVELIRSDVFVYYLSKECKKMFAIEMVESILREKLDDIDICGKLVNSSIFKLVPSEQKIPALIQILNYHSGEPIQIPYSYLSLFETFALILSRRQAERSALDCSPDL
ncbi:MAG: hypothetical protein LBJ93_03635 [Clostridiales bacterium]|nr:hypothetical protein [Clostridiales bacterium]